MSRSVVDLPQPDGPEQHQQPPGRGLEADVVDRAGRAPVLGDPAQRHLRHVPRRRPYRPTIASTSARRKRSTTSMNTIDGTSRISAVIEAIW